MCARALSVHCGGRHGFHRVTVLNEGGRVGEGIDLGVNSVFDVDTALRVNAHLRPNLLGGPLLHFVVRSEQVSDLLVVDLQHLHLAHDFAAALANGVSALENFFDDAQQDAPLTRDFCLTYDGGRLASPSLPIREQRGIVAAEGVVDHPLTEESVDLSLRGVMLAMLITAFHGSVDGKAHRLLAVGHRQQKNGTVLLDPQALALPPLVGHHRPHAKAHHDGL
mmetsp:Transcript_66680/g.185880  ORF Transcript_66680/g.185880 Transcript_66680/m.185880 type:complete len:222 (-) Transcript_66680:91-756(-)